MMKMKIIGFIIVLLCCLMMPVPVNSATLRVTPSSIILKLAPGAYSEDLEFVVNGFEGVLTISSENMPVLVRVISPSPLTGAPFSINVKEGTIVKLALKSEEYNVSLVTHTGAIIFSPKGSSATKVTCVLNVAKIVIPSTSTIPAPAKPSATKPPISPITGTSPSASSVKYPASSNPLSNLVKPEEITNEIIQRVAEGTNAVKPYGLWIVSGIVALFVIVASVYVIARRGRDNKRRIILK